MLVLMSSSFSLAKLHTLDDLELLTKLFSGTFDSGPQHSHDTARHAPLSDFHPHVQSVFFPFHAAVFGASSKTVYVEEREIKTPTDYTNNSAIYRQRIAEFTTREPEGDILLRLWSFANASAYIGAQHHPADLQNVTMSSLHTNEFCDVYWMREGVNTFVSRMGTRCNFTLSGTFYRVEGSGILGEDYVTVHERWYAENGTQVSGLDTPINETRVPASPQQIAPVMPTMFSAKVHGFAKGMNETGVWHYDWPRYRLRSDYVILEEGSSRPQNVTQLWFANNHSFYVFQEDSCQLIDLNVGMLRPDAFEHSLKVDPEGTYYAGREFVDNQWTDHYASAKHGGLWTSLETNDPVLDWGASGAGGLGANHWSDFQVGRQPETLYQMDTSKCTQSAAPFDVILKSVLSSARAFGKAALGIRSIHL